MVAAEAPHYSTMSSTSRTIFLTLLGLHHITAWVRMAMIKDLTVIDLEVQRKLSVYKDFGPRFLTNWNFFNQTVYIFMALYVTLAPRILKNQTKLVTKLRKLSRFNFWSVVFPWSVFIPMFFWSIYIYDRELIFPSYIDYIFPHWLNHAIHTNIGFVVLFEMLTNNERPPLFKKALRVLTIYAIFYVFVLNFTYFYNGVWLYVFLNLLNWPQRIVVFSGTYVFLVTFLWLGLKYQDRRYRRLVAGQVKSQ